MSDIRLMFAPITKYRLRQVIAVTIFWVVAGVIIETNNGLIYNYSTGRYELFFPFGATPLQHILITALGPLIGGLTGGALILFVLRDALRQRSFIAKLIIQSVVFIILIFLLVMLVGAVQASTMPGVFSENFVEVVFTWRVFRLMITWFVVVIGTLVVLDVGEKYGKGMLWRIISGKYHKPVVERRVFMFMDIKESTRLTEMLGDERYFQMLRSVFYLVTDPVLNCEGEIYQYVGDEIIIHWKDEKGFHNNNCLRCYYAVNSAIRSQAESFVSNYGVIPEFRAAVHMGQVVTGEIGVIKKDIVFSGDVLNSSSRLLGRAKDLGVRFVASQSVMKRLELQGEFELRYLESLVLRGKSVETQLFEVKMIDTAI